MFRASPARPTHSQEKPCSQESAAPFKRVVGGYGIPRLGVSAAVTLLVLAVFGFVEGHFTGVPKMKGALQTALVGSLAAGVAYVIAKFIA